jgi:hypothetical protein
VRRFAMTLTMAMAGTAAVATTAEAATFTIAPAQPCYISGGIVTGTGGAFTPASVVDVLADGSRLGAVTADAAGGFVTPPITLGQMRGVKTHTLTATDPANPALTASASFLGTTNTVTFKPRRATPGTRIRIKGWGFLGGPRVYMHVRGRGFKSDRRIARTSGPCGLFTTRVPIVPAGTSPGTYNLQFDSKRRYSRRTTPSVLARLRVYRVAG